MEINNALALATKNPEIDYTTPLLTASKLKQADDQNALTQLTLKDRADKQNALADYSARAKAGDPKAADALISHPETYAQVVQTRNSVAEADRKTYDDNLMRNARGAQRVMGITDPTERAAAWKEELDQAVKEKRIDPNTYKRLAGTPPNDLVLSNILRAGLSLEQHIALDQKDKSRTADARAAGVFAGKSGDDEEDPATPAARAPVAATPKVWGDAEATAAGLYPAATPAATATPALAATPAPPAVPPVKGKKKPDDLSGIVTALANPDISPGTRAVGMELLKNRLGDDKFSAVHTTDAAGNPAITAFNTKTGEAKPAATPSGQPAAPAPNPDLTGDDFLSTMDPARAATVKSLVEGRMPPPGSFALKSPYIQGLMRDAAQYEPGFDQTLWKTRNSMLQSATSGKIGQGVASFNTAIGHLETLDKAIDGLNNGRFPMWNTIANAARGQVDPEFKGKVNQFETAKTAVIDELTRAFRGTGGNVHDLVQWEKSINGADSPEALKAATRQAAELLRSRIEALGDQYNRGMQTKVPKDALDFLSPKAKAAMQKLTGEAAPANDKATPGAAPAGVPALPPGFQLVPGKRADAGAEDTVTG